MTQLEIANVALGHLGTVSLVSYNENTPQGIHIRRQWDLARAALIRQRHWNWAIKRDTLDLVDQVALTGIATTSGSASITVASATGLTVGMSIKADFVPRGTTITAIVSLTVTLSAQANVTDTSLTATAYTAPAFGWAFQYELPADYLRALTWNDREAGTNVSSFDLESGVILCDDEEAELRYVADITDTALWDSNFVEAFALKLAARICPGVTTATGLADKLDQKAEAYLMKAFGPDNGETRPRVVRAETNSKWLEAREGLDERFA